MRFLAISLLNLSLTACNVRMNEQGGVSINPATDSPPPPSMVQGNTSTETSRPEDKPNETINVEVNNTNQLNTDTTSHNYQCKEENITQDIWEKAVIVGSTTPLMSGSNIIKILNRGEEVHKIGEISYQNCKRYWFVKHPQTGLRGWVEEDQVSLVHD